MKVITYFTPLLLSLLLMGGCGPKADSKSAETQRFRFGYQDFIIGDKEIDPEVRSMTLLNLPLTEDMQGFSYEPNPDDWKVVFGSVSYGHRVPYGIGANLSNFEKATGLSYLTLVSGDVRNNSFELIQEYKQELKEILDEVGPLLQRHPCYQIMRGPDRRRCSPEANDNTRDEPRFASSCSTLERWERLFVNLTDEQEERLLSDIKRCQEVDGGRQEELETEIAYHEDVRSKAKGIVLDSLNQAEKNAKTHFVATGASKGDEDTVNGYKSLIQMNADRSAFTKFQLAIDFNIGKGYQLFSLENGLIKNFYYREVVPNVWQLNFDLVNDVYWLSAELSADVSETYGFRLSGETEVNFSDGTQRKGVMKLELDLIESE